MVQRLVISGCSGGGKSTLIAALAERGCQVVREAGRELVREQLAAGGKDLPGTPGFTRALLARACAQYDSVADATGPVYFDRSMIECLSWYDENDQMTQERRDLIVHRRYAAPVFLTPPWPEIYVTDAERTHGLDAAIEEYDRLAAAFPRYGYETIEIPRTSVAERVNFILRHTSERSHKPE